MSKFGDIEFIKLLGEVEIQGGGHSAKICSQRIYDRDGDAGDVTRVEKRIMPGCGMPSFLEIPYDPYADVTVDEPVMVPDPKRKGCHISKKRWVMRDGKSVEEVETKKVLRQGPIEKRTSGELRLIEVCAYHDGAFQWPRFRETVT